MNTFMRLTFWVGIVAGYLVIATMAGSAHAQGFLNPSPSGMVQDMLPPGAVHEGTQVLHPITSSQENLHLLAGYYYGNTRLWKKIYNANRNLIKNPNRLPVGQTLRIQVDAGWQPRFAYQEWFQLATRNGEWKPDVPWQRAVDTTFTAAPLPEAAPTVPPAVAPAIEPQIAPTLPAISTPMPAPKMEVTPAVVATPVVQPLATATPAAENAPTSERAPAF